ncbi:Gfo/Idh/MocA family protein [Microbacterium sp. 179-B 1A2 NHS]|uniref:Gfo/Idh/MocA family protein n=1 Tax=Microbacterium sp. 179-B 1A2 NHS TaxID=3142383 RepID=UPI00399F73B4
MADPVRFAIIGTGWRSEFHLRMAAAAPDRLEAVAVLARSDDSAARVAEWGVRVVRTIDELLAMRPDFVIASVTWPAMPGVVTELVERGIRVLAETPPAPDADGLRSLWGAVGSSGLVQVAEQYMLMPGHAARLEVIRSGAIGTPTAVQVASTHLYHATSMIRSFLDAGMAEATVSARSFTAPLVDPLSPRGWSEDLSPKDRTTLIGTLDFGDGRMGLYDFVDNQWWNPLLSRRVVVRGTHGEVADDTVRRMAGSDVLTSPITYRRTGIDLNLEGNDVVTAAFEGRIVYRNPWVGTRLSEDDIAVASLLELTGRWAREEGPAPYPLADACQDHLLGLAMEQSARTGADVRVAREAWA